MLTPVFFSPEMNVDGLESYSPSAGKPKRFCELLAHHDFRSYGPESLGKVEPVTKEDLCLVHKPSYISGLFALREPNGFGNCDPRVPESVLWTVGSLLSASRHAMKYPVTPVCSPSSGYHHADYDSAGGYCTANGLIVVAAKLIEENPFIKIGIIDADAHYADGSFSLLKRHQRIGQQVLHFTSGQHFHGDDALEALDFQAWLHSVIKEMNAYQPDLVLYQAGADAWMEDPLQSGYLTEAQLIQRDRDVFQGIRAPIVWNLAGGYARSPDNSIFTDPVLRIHRSTLIESDKSVKVRETFFESKS
jgi:acetoin utilization deacetylase AcuC-like enzyme